MKITVYNNNYMETNCYVLETEEVAVVIDPCIDYTLLSNKVKSKLRAVFITHGHFDHFISLESYKEKKLSFYMSEKCYQKLSNSFKNCSSLGYSLLEVDLSNESVTYVCDGKEIIIEDICIKCLETIGHSNCSMTYLIDDKMFCGDFIFKGSIGRTDLITGSQENMNKSIKKFKEIDNDYVLYPGHGDVTTLLDEKKNNYYFR